MEEVKAALKDTFIPGKEGIKVSGVRKGRNGVVLTLGNDASRQTVMTSPKLKERGLKVETPAQWLPRVSIFGMERDIEKPELVELVHSQNAKGLISEAEFK